MTKLDKWFGYVIFGFIIFITCFCAGWWINPGNGITLSIGIAVGIVLNAIFLKRIVYNMYKLNYLFMILVFVMYSIGMFGFFMGVPCFNILLAVFIGYYIGRRMKSEIASEIKFKSVLKKGNGITIVGLLLICIASAYIALRDPYTASNIKGMLGLSFKPDLVMLLSVIVIGGLGLTSIQYIVTKKVAEKVYKIAR